MKNFFRRLFCKNDCRYCEYFSCKRMSNQKPNCYRSRCIYLFGIGKDTIFCEQCIHAYLDSADVFDEIKELEEEYKSKTIIDGQYCWQTCGATEHCKECNRLFNGSIDYYENYENLVGECDDGWIPCSERLPEKYLHCLVTRRNDYEDGTYDSDVREDVYMELEGVWWWQSKFEGLFDDIIAWKPLPSPYQPKGE